MQLNLINHPDVCEQVYKRLRSGIYGFIVKEFRQSAFDVLRSNAEGKAEELLETLNLRQRSLGKYFSENERLTIQDFHRMYPNVTRRTLIRDLNDLVEKGLLKRHGVKRGTYYTLA